MTKCTFLLQNTVKAYPCGSDHTPSPMASRESQEAKAVLEMSSYRLTAVAVSGREGHSIVFLGDTKGMLYKVSLPILHKACLQMCNLVFKPLKTPYDKQIVWFHVSLALTRVTGAPSRSQA